MAVRRLDADEGWINRKFADLQRQLNELRAAKRLQAATIGKGGLTVKDGGNITILDGAGVEVWSALDGPIKSFSHAQSLDSPGLTSSWAEYLTYTVPIPSGFTSCMISLFTSTGATAAVGGTINVGTRPVANGGALAGPGLATGSATSSPVSVTSAWTWSGPVGTSLTIGVQAFLQGAITAGTDNVHLSGTVLFLR